MHHSSWPCSVLLQLLSSHHFIRPYKARRLNLTRPPCQHDVFPPLRSQTSTRPRAGFWYYHQCYSPTVFGWGGGWGTHQSNWLEQTQTDGKLIKRGTTAHLVRHSDTWIPVSPQERGRKCFILNWFGSWEWWWSWWGWVDWFAVYAAL